MRGNARVATILGRTMVVVGLLLIFLAWNGAAGEDCVQCQFPYLLSGSVPGLALVLVGAGLECVQTTRQLTAERATQMAAVNTAMARLVEFVRDGGDLAATPSAPAPSTTAQSDAERLAALAYADSAFDTKDTAEHSDTEEVVAGRASFHKPTCHLVSGRDDMEHLVRSEALERNLTPCRVCKP